MTVVDLNTRKIVTEIDTPGCTQIYPSGDTSFMMQCGSGAAALFKLDAAGKFVKREDSKIFNDIDNDALFVVNARVGDTVYFLSFKGNIRPVSLAGNKMDVQDAWSLLSDDDKAKKVRPGGWQVIAGGDIDCNIYVLVHEDGVNGSHKNGGSKVYVYNPKTKKKIRTIALKEWGVSIAVTRGKTPYLAVTNGNMDMDVYDGRTGKHIRVIGGGATQHAFQIYPVK